MKAGTKIPPRIKGINICNCPWKAIVCRRLGNLKKEGRGVRSCLLRVCGVDVIQNLLSYDMYEDVDDQGNG